VNVAIVICVFKRTLKRVKDFVSPSVSAELWRDFFAMAQVKQIADIVAVVWMTKRHYQGDCQFGTLELDMVPFLANKPVRRVVEVSNTFSFVLVGQPPVVRLSRYYKGVFFRR